MRNKLRNEAEGKRKLLLILTVTEKMAMKHFESRSFWRDHLVFKYMNTMNGCLLYKIKIVTRFKRPRDNLGVAAWTLKGMV
jgi:hypothetical protein